jgi:hypothetical protein
MTSRVMKITNLAEGSQRLEVDLSWNPGTVQYVQYIYWQRAREGKARES